jgi:hypothetical protein
MRSGRRRRSVWPRLATRPRAVHALRLAMAAQHHLAAVRMSIFALASAAAQHHQLRAARAATQGRDRQAAARERPCHSVTGRSAMTVLCAWGVSFCAWACAIDLKVSAGRP